MSAALRDAAWSELRLGEPYDALPDRQGPNDKLVLLQGLARADDKHQYLAEVFDRRQDTLPPSRAALIRKLGDPRLAVAPRLFHRLGACAKVRLTIGPRSPYTGLLAPGVEVHGIARASLTASDTFSPGVGLKWFVTRGPTVNLLANHSFEGHSETSGFFAERMRTVLDPPKSAPWIRAEAKAAAHAAVGFFMGALAWWRRRATAAPPNPLQIDLTPLCSTTLAGDRVSPVIAPQFLVLRGAAGVNQAYLAAAGDDFRVRLAALPAGPLLTVEDEQRTELGAIALESPFVASPAGDAVVFFHHPFAR